MTEQVKTLAELKEDADGLGIEYKDNWGAKKIKAAIEARLAELDISADDEPKLTVEPDVAPDDEPEQAIEPKPAKTGGCELLNIGKRTHMIAGRKLLPGESVTLTREQLSDERLMAKIKTSIRCGVLKEVK